MKISLIKTRGQKEVITRYSLEEVAYAIQNGWRQRNVTYLREVYHLMNKERQPDGQIQTDWQGGIKLEPTGKVASNWSASALPRNSTDIGTSDAYWAIMVWWWLR